MSLLLLAMKWIKKQLENKDVLRLSGWKAMFKEVDVEHTLKQKLGKISKGEEDTR